MREVIHDLPDPVGALAGMRRVTGAGAVLVIDEKAAHSFEPTGDPIERLLYAFGILHCLPAGRAAKTSATTGTVIRPDAFGRYARLAGFTAVETLPIEHPMFRSTGRSAEAPALPPDEPIQVTCPTIDGVPLLSGGGIPPDESLEARGHGDHPIRQPAASGPATADPRP